MTTAAVEPLYATLADRFRRQIHRGELRPGDKLPSEQEIVARERVSRGTVRRAIDELIAEGLIVSINGRGHQVRQSTTLLWRASDPERICNAEAVSGPVDAWSRAVRAQGHEPAEEIRAEITYADQYVAGMLVLAVGEPVAVRRRTRYVNGEPYCTADSFYPRSIVAGTEIEEPGDVLPGVWAVFARLGRPWVTTVDRIIARMPTRDESQLLHIPRGVAVAEIARRSFDEAGTPVRLTRFVHPGDRHEIEYEHREEQQ